MVARCWREVALIRCKRDVDANTLSELKDHILAGPRLSPNPINVPALSLCKASFRSSSAICLQKDV